MIKAIIRRIAMKTGKLRGLYLRVVQPGNEEYVAFLRRHEGFHHIGKNVQMNYGTVVTDPGYVSIGNNVVLSECHLIPHDGSVEVLHHIYGTSVDAVDKIVIHDNVFVGFGAVILRGVTIGPNAIVGAGAVVVSDVPEGTIVGGVPARVIGTVANYHERLKAETDKLPWGPLIRTRKNGYDPEMEPELHRQRLKHFFPERYPG